MGRLKNSVKEEVERNHAAASEAARRIDRAVNTDEDSPDYVYVRGASYWNATACYKAEIAKNIVVSYETPDEELAHKVAHAVALAIHQHRIQKRLDTV